MSKRHITLRKTLAPILIIMLALSVASCKWGSPIGDTLSNMSYTPGSWDGKTYTGEFLNTNLNVSDGWTIANQEELENEKEIIIADSMADSQAPQEEIERGIIYELKITNDRTHSEMNIVLKDMDIIYSMAYSEEDFMNIYRKSMQSMTIGTVRISEMSEPERVTLGGNEYLTTEIEYSNNQKVSHYQRIYLRKIGTYMVNLTMSVSDPEEFKDIESMFSQYK